MVSPPGRRRGRRRFHETPAGEGARRRRQRRKRVTRNDVVQRTRINGNGAAPIGLGDAAAAALIHGTIEQRSQRLGARGQELGGDNCFFQAGEGAVVRKGGRARGDLALSDVGNREEKLRLIAEGGIRNTLGTGSATDRRGGDDDRRWPRREALAEGDVHRGKHRRQLLCGERRSSVWIAVLSELFLTTVGLAAAKQYGQLVEEARVDVKAVIGILRVQFSRGIPARKETPRTRAPVFFTRETTFHIPMCLYFEAIEYDIVGTTDAVSS